MSWGWQEVGALGLVAAAAAYLARLSWRAVRRTTSGGGCGAGAFGSCPSSRAPAATAGPPGSFVALDALGPAGRRRRPGESEGTHGGRS